MIAKDDRHTVALARFLATRPDLEEEIQPLDAREQQQQIQWAFEDAAQSEGLQPWELTLELTAENPQELQAMRLEVHREAAQALDMDWHEYCAFNDLKP